MGVDEIRALVMNALEDLNGNYSRHVKSVAGNVEMEAKKAGHPPIGVEGETDGEWMLVDLADVVVHVMQPQIRKFYDLENLWQVDLSRQQESF